MSVPEGVVLGQVNAERRARAAVIELGYPVAGQVLRGDEHGPDCRVAEDGRDPGAALVLDQFGLAGEDGLDRGVGIASEF